MATTGSFSQKCATPTPTGSRPASTTAGHRSRRTRDRLSANYCDPHPPTNAISHNSGAEQAGPAELFVQLNGLGVKFVDRLALGVEDVEELPHDGVDPRGVTGLVGGAHELPVEPLVVGAGEQAAAGGPGGARVVVLVEVAAGELLGGVADSGLHLGPVREPPLVITWGGALQGDATDQVEGLAQGEDGKALVLSGEVGEGLEPGPVQADQGA